MTKSGHGHIIAGMFRLRCILLRFRKPYTYNTLQR